MGPSIVCSESNGFQRVNQFALVSYIPDPLGGFLDELRLHLVPDCKPHAHVTILPPRPLCGEVSKAIEEIGRIAREFPPFRVRLGETAKFPVSDVVYIDLSEGCRELCSMYEAMNCGASSFCEQFPYSPHITLAQNIPAGKVEELFEAAKACWRSCPYDRSFLVNTLSFVQNTNVCRWLDLATFQLTLKHKVTQTTQAEPLHRV